MENRFELFKTINSAEVKVILHGRETRLFEHPVFGSELLRFYGENIPKGIYVGRETAG